MLLRTLCIVFHLGSSTAAYAVSAPRAKLTHCGAVYLIPTNSIIATLVGLPPNLRYAVAQWNATTHGNVTFVVFLMVSRQVLYICLDQLMCRVDVVFQRPTGQPGFLVLGGKAITLGNRRQPLVRRIERSSLLCKGMGYWVPRIRTQTCSHNALLTCDILHLIPIVPRLLQIWLSRRMSKRVATIKDAPGAYEYTSFAATAVSCECKDCY